jgi:hypothetical protein
MPAEDLAHVEGHALLSDEDPLDLLHHGLLRDSGVQFLRMDPVVLGKIVQGLLP